MLHNANPSNSHETILPVYCMSPIQVKAGSIVHCPNGAIAQSWRSAYTTPLLSPQRVPTLPPCSVLKECLHYPLLSPEGVPTLPLAQSWRSAYTTPLLSPEGVPTLPPCSVLKECLHYPLLSPEGVPTLPLAQSWRSAYTTPLLSPEGVPTLPPCSVLKECLHYPLLSPEGVPTLPPCSVPNDRLLSCIIPLKLFSMWAWLHSQNILILSNISILS